ncbi:MAG: histidine kinase [Ferruginibacter sp.]
MRTMLLGATALLITNTCPAQQNQHGPYWSEPAYWWPVSLILIAALLLLLYNYRKKNRLLKQEQQKNRELGAYRTADYRHQLEMEQVINYFTRSMYNHSTEEEVLWDITRNCISKLGFEDCVIYLVDREKNVLVQKAAWGPKTTEENKIVNPLQIPVGSGIVGHVARSGRAEIINDTSRDSRYIVDDEQRFSELAVPVIQHEEVIGVMDCEHSQKNFYTQRHLQIMETIAALCADSLEKIRTAEEARQKEQHLALLREKLAASQLTALRTQMNPHFIFNALNSVQQYILEGDVDKANRYLTKFSRLQREILQHCDQHFITLEKEMEMLRLYLEFEQLRFDENFRYEMNIPADIDSSEIKIPPMLLQPFVENAIWHGLMPKQGKKELYIGFALKGEDELECTIADNGIGIEASARLQQQSNKKRHDSKGMSLVNGRLAILEQQYNHPFRLSMSDRINGNGEPEGTCIKLQIFIGY